MIEREKYTEVWKHAQYRELAPGEHSVELFLKLAKPRSTDTVIDFGCGTGRAGLALAKHANVRLVDFAGNCLDTEVRQALNGRIRFETHDLTQPFQGGPERFGYCTDVMEHIPTADVPKVLRNILHAARHVFFQISCEPDQLGVLIGEQLHLTVQPYAWWLERFNELHCSVHWSHDAGSMCAFYVSAWATGKDFHSNAAVNTDDATIKANVLANLEPGLPEVRPHEAQDRELMLLCGGPSLNGFERRIRNQRLLGMGLVTVNGAYNWCMERGIKPSAQIVLDAREFNKRFVQPVVPDCRYLLASQCHPETVRAVPPEQVVLWHSGSSEAVKSALDEYDQTHGKAREWFPVYGGMTVPLRAFPLLLMLGFSRFHVYGFDSCLSGDAHHAYAQPENDEQRVVEVTCGQRTFRCHPWMLTQAHEFQEMVRLMLADTCEIEVYGDGLIRHILQTGAELNHGGLGVHAL
jgi:SAM-dependent methyltransferase